MTATICPPSEKLKALSLGELSHEESDDLIAHVSTCESCRHDLDTINDSEDSLIASLRDPDELADFEAEPNRQVAMAKALGALADGGEVDRRTASLTNLPQQIGEYEIVRPLGRGGMGSVYLARHTKLGREVALKVLAHHRLTDQRIRDRFEAEMQAVGRLSHPNIVSAHDAREVEGTAVLVTEFIDGFDLGELLQRTGPISVANSCEIIRQIAVALEYTSRQGFVHRDVKPSNIMLSHRGQVKLLDLGLARFQLGDADRPELTGTGQAMGTADFLAPEQVNDSRSVDVRADIYSLGCTFFKLLTGVAPFGDDRHATAFAKMTAHVSTAPPSLRDCCPDAPGRLVKLVDSMLAKEPELRPQTGRQVADELAPLTKGNDLQQLVEQAEQSEPKPPSDAHSPTVLTPQTKPLFRRQVPVSLLIATALVSLSAGFLLGIIVKIRYPDGTSAELHVPDGGRLTIVPDERDVPADDGSSETLGDPNIGTQFPPNASGDNIPTYDVLPETADPTASRAPGEAWIQHRAEEFAPLFFAILDDREFGPNGIKQPIAKQESIVWYPLADNVSVSNSQVGPPHEAGVDKQYAPVKSDPESRIRWQDIQGHMGAQTMVGGGSDEVRIDLHFDEELGAKMRRLSAANIDRQLAIVFNNRIIAAPHIRSVFGERAEIAGRFKSEEIRYLMQSLSGGLVDPLPNENAGNSTGDAAATRTELSNRLQGVWQVTHAMDNGQQSVMTDIMLIGFRRDRFYLVYGDRVISGGSFKQVNPDNHVPLAIDLHNEINGSSTTPGIVRFLPSGEAQLCLNERGDIRPTAFESERDSPNDLWMTLKPLNQQQLPIEFSWSWTKLQSLLKDADQEQRNPAAGDLTELENARKQILTIALALLNYESAHGHFPASASTDEGSHPYSWRVAILPFIERPDLYEQYRFDERWDSEHNRKLIDQMPDLYRSTLAPADQQPGETNYVGFSGDQTALGVEEGVTLGRILDGASRTLLIAETQATVPWTKPEDFQFEKPEDAQQAIPFDGKALRVGMADASVREIEADDWQNLAKLITRAGGEVIDMD